MTPELRQELEQFRKRPERHQSEAGVLLFVLRKFLLATPQERGEPSLVPQLEACLEHEGLRKDAATGEWNRQATNE